jgi:protein phosphatase methylesterase 1
MSELQRKWAKAKISAMTDLNTLDQIGEDHDEISELPEFADDDSSSASSASSASSTGTIIPSPSRNLFARPQG